MNNEWKKQRKKEKAHHKYKDEYADFFETNVCVHILRNDNFHVCTYICVFILIYWVSVPMHPVLESFIFTAAPNREMKTEKNRKWEKIKIHIIYLFFFVGSFRILWEMFGGAWNIRYTHSTTPKNITTRSIINCIRKYVSQLLISVYIRSIFVYTRQMPHLVHFFFLLFGKKWCKRVYVCVFVS